MRRRDFSALAGLALPTLSASAQTALKEGAQYRRLTAPLARQPGRVDVLEFFLFSCPACFALDPSLEAWRRQLPADVAFRRIHLGGNLMSKMLQRMFFTLEALGVEEQVHSRVFNAIHLDRMDVSKDEAISALLSRVGVDAAKFAQAKNSFGVQAKMQQADQLVAAYKVDSVPTLGIGGRFVTAPSMAGQATLGVVDQLIKMARDSS